MEQRNGDKAKVATATKIRMLRAAENVGREEFAMYLGISRFLLTSWERGETEPPQNYRQKIDAAFGAAVAEILSAELESEKETSSYLICLQRLPDMPTHALKNLSGSIETLIRTREKKAKNGQ